MKRTLLIVSFLAMFSGSAWAQKSKPSSNTKLDQALTQLIAANKPGVKVKVIIQFNSPLTNSSIATITKGGGQINRQFRTIPSIVVTVPSVLVNILAKDPLIKHITLDRPVKSFDQTPGEPYVVSGSQLANQTYNVTGQGIGVAVID